MVFEEIRNIAVSKKVVIAVMFVIAALFILYIFPTNAKFEYIYEQNGIWEKESLTAPFEFVIYKNEKDLQKEKDSIILKYYQPYFNISESEKERAISKLANPSSSSDIADHYTKHIRTQLYNIYQRGIISVEEYQNLIDNHIDTIRVKSDDMKASIALPVSMLYTPKTAYETIFKNAPTSLDTDILRAYNIDALLRPNLTYDEKTSDLSREDLIRKQVCLTKGKVQENETIVNHGSKIDKDTYDKLVSFEKSIRENNDDSTVLRVKAGQLLIITASLLTFFMYLTLFRQKFIKEYKNVFFMLGMICLLCMVTSVIVTNMPDYVYIIPYAILPIVITVFFDTRTALFMHNTTVLICSFIVHEGVEFLLMQVIIGMITICIIKDLYERSQLVTAAIIIGGAYCILYCGSMLMYNSSWSNKEISEYLYALLPFVINATLLLFTYPLIYIIEKLFNYISDVTLIELANINHPLLVQFADTAPSSFEHAMKVSTLATAAAKAIGANPSLARTGALYHDIGKMQNPIYFTENQNKNMPNPHDELNDEEKSASIIIKHVTDGMEIAKKHGLPQKVQDFIKTHHGDGVVKYFYIKAKNKNPEAEIDLAKFTYPGPKPSTKEQAIVMMCDAVEAASHSLSEPTEENIVKLVNNIINGQMTDGAFQVAPITLRNIEDIKIVLIEKLKSINHTRIKYPELKK